MCASVLAMANKVTANEEMANEDSFVSAFNACSSPKEVVTLVEKLGLSLDEVCSRLHAAAGHVDADILGSCLGHHHDFWQQFASCFPCHFDFSGLELVTALRRYLWRFRLPGEAAPIGRILEGFALGYFNAHPPRVASKPPAKLVAPGVPFGIEPSAHGWFVHQPRTAKSCCIACGSLERPDSALRSCTGCGVVAFCPRCSRSASRYGHAINACIGFGRACESAARLNGRLSEGCITYASPVLKGGPESAFVGEADRGNWVRSVSPINSQDAVFVLSYAIVMLSTNLHNPSVRKSDRMELHQFLAQLREQNDGAPFPGDFVEGIYDAIKAEELKVRTV